MQLARYEQYLNLMHQWLILKQEGKSIEQYLIKRGYHVVAIYGMAIYGRHALRDLYGTGVKVAYGIDRKEMNPYKGVMILRPTSDLPKVDVIINTVIRQHISIKEDLSKIVEYPVISLEDVIYESYNS